MLIFLGMSSTCPHTPPTKSEDYENPKGFGPSQSPENHLMKMPKMRSELKIRLRKEAGVLPSLAASISAIPTSL
jgi:hypothetical protein